MFNLIFKEILILLISLTGIIFGIILALISPEEFKEGKKYFIILKKILFSIIGIILIYGFLKKWSFLISSITIPIVISTTILIVLFKVKSDQNINKAELLIYLYFISTYFLINELNIQMILASLIFIYGLPTGTILKNNFNEKIKKIKHKKDKVSEK